MDDLLYARSILAYAWKHAYLSYDNPRKSNYNQTLTDSEFFYFQNATDYAYMAIFDDHIIISFRGTDNVKGWLSNLDPYPLKDHEYMKKYVKDGKWGKGIIHDGFYTDWLFFKSCIDKVFSNQHVIHKGKKIIVTGHSRGGAFAELCARHLAKNRGHAVSCFTFGCPAVGTKKYRDQFRSLTINGTRVVHGWDIVPTTPPSYLGFRHGCSNLIHKKKAYWKKWIPWIRFNDHRSGNYDKYIMKRYLRNA
jgi:predicted lipase